MVVMENELNSREAELLRAFFDVARRAAAAVNRPFGAILAVEEGQILLEAENTVVTGDDITGHAETNLVRMIRKDLSECETDGPHNSIQCQPFVGAGGQP